MRIAELHRNYTAECEPMCAALEKSEAEVLRLIGAEKHMTPLLEPDNYLAQIDAAAKAKAGGEGHKGHHE